MHRMQQLQILQSRRIRQAMTLITGLNLQFVEMKKRIEEVDTKNRELFANIKQISFGSEVAVSKKASVEAYNNPEDEPELVLSCIKRRADDGLVLPTVLNKTPRID